MRFSWLSINHLFLGYPQLWKNPSIPDSRDCWCVPSFFLNSIVETRAFVFCIRFLQEPMLWNPKTQKLLPFLLPLAVSFPLAGCPQLGGEERRGGCRDPGIVHMDRNCAKLLEKCEIHATCKYSAVNSCRQMHFASRAEVWGCEGCSTEEGAFIPSVATVFWAMKLIWRCMCRCQPCSSEWPN